MPRCWNLHCKKQGNNAGWLPNEFGEFLVSKCWKNKAGVNSFELFEPLTSWIQNKSKNPHFWSQDAGIWFLITRKIMLGDCSTNFETFGSQNVQKSGPFWPFVRDLKDIQKSPQNFHFWCQDAGICIVRCKEIMLGDCLTNLGSFWSQNVEKTRPE